MTGYVESHPNHACPYLPPELWALVLSHVNDFDLWINCRRVAKNWQTEAEREFGRIRLRDLHIAWSNRGVIKDDDDIHPFDGSTKTTRFAKLSEDCSQAFFNIESDGKIAATHDLNMEGKDAWMMEEVVKGVTRSLHYSDIDFLSRFEGFGDFHMEQACRLGSHINDVQLPALQIDYMAKVISFDWKIFLNDFYGDYARVQQKLQRQISTHTKIENTVARAEAYLAKHSTSSKMFPYIDDSGWMANFGSEEAEAFKEAYMARIKRSHMSIGKEFDLAPLLPAQDQLKLCETLLWHVTSGRICRNAVILRKWKEARDIDVTADQNDDDGT